MEYGSSSPLDAFLIDYIKRGVDAVDTPERRVWYENLKRGGCLDENDRLIMSMDDVIVQFALWKLCARGLVRMVEEG